ncbi:MAG: hypothetical protein H6719_06595 [Sandaracinaceae bacterium]|nr:hypothetical protein [Sandaracinaceae bacterium]
MRWPSVWAGLALLACADPSPPDAGTSAGTDAGVTGAVAVFDLDRLATGELLSVPFPSDLYRDADGTVSIGAVPGVRDREAFASIRRLAALRGGFCTTCAAHFAIEGALEAVPASTDGSLDDAALLVDLEPGAALPLRLHYGQGELALRPAPGIVLARDHRYVAVLTDALRAADGTPLRPSADFLALRDAGGDGVIADALDALDAIGVPWDRVVALAPFTTGDPTSDLRRARALVAEGAPPSITVDRVLDAAALDELLGVPATTGPGIDAAPRAGSEGTRAIAHETTLVAVTGTFDAPRLVEGVGVEVGVPRRDATGALVAGPREAVPFVLLVPAGADLARLPVVLSLHGFNASRVTGFALTDTAGRAGAAVLAIDHYQHGERAASARDELHAMRGELAGPDGFAETSPLDVSARVFGYSGVARGAELSADYSLASLLQFASDAMAALRVLREGDASPLRDASAELATLAFDPDRLFVVGNSLGAEITTLVLAVDPDVAGAVLNVWPGGIVDNLADSPEFRPIVESLFAPPLGLDGPFDEPARGLSFDLVVDLYRYALEPADPLAMAPHLARDPLGTGALPDLLVQLGELDEVAAPVASEAAVAAAGVPCASPLRFAVTDEVALPVTANLAGRTVVCVRYPGGGHGMMELRTQESRYEPPAVPPFMRRPSPLPVTNPIDAIHAHIEQLLSTRTAATRATIGE